MNSKIVVALALTCALSWQTDALCKDIYADRVAAVVNGDVILESDIKKHDQPLIRQMIPIPLGVVPPGKAPTEREILDELVIVHLLQQEAARLGIKVDDQSVQAGLESIKRSRHLTQDQLVLQLELNGLNYSDYRSLLKRQILLTKLIHTEIQQKVPLSEDDAKLYFKEHKNEIEKQFQKMLRDVSGPQPAEPQKPDIPTHMDTYIGGKIRLRQITLKLPSDAKKKDVEAIKAKAKLIHEQMATGADFAQLAKKYSQDANAAKGGDLGFIQYKDMLPELQKMVQRMKEGDVTPPFPMRDGVIIFYLDEAKNRQPKQVPVPEKVRKQYEEEWKKMQEAREAQRKKQSGPNVESEPESAEDVTEDKPTQDSKNKAANQSAILTPEEDKEYRKVRRKVMGIVRHEKVLGRLKDWISELKKDSIIEVKI